MYRKGLTIGEPPKVYILLLNWNGWQDTIECLESVFRNDYQNYRVIVCDNDSTDSSVERIKHWADGQLCSFTSLSNSLRSTSFPPIEKPVAYCEYNRAQAEAGGDKHDRDARLILIQTGANLGFAGGNNVGLRYALARDDFDYVWLLNNDTVIQSDALQQLVSTASADDSIGMCGSTLRYYNNPIMIQTLGGGYINPVLGLTHHVRENQIISRDDFDGLTIVKPLDYIIGASMLVSRAFLRAVGEMSEEYFLYFEELDWATRARGKFKLQYALKSVVYHKSGQSVGNKFNDWSPTSVFYSTRSRLKFTRKFYPQFLLFVYVRLFVSLVNQTLKGKRAQAQAIWKAMTTNNSHDATVFRKVSSLFDMTFAILLVGRILFSLVL